MKNIIIPLPHHDFDPTEVAIPWKLMCDAGFDVHFATPDGQTAQCDPMMISGEGLDPWAWIPLLKKLRLFGLLLRADTNARNAYQALIKDSNFNQAKAYTSLKVEDYDGLLLPGGHAPKMKPYLENKDLQTFVAAFFENNYRDGKHKPVAAICHGVVLAARSISSQTQKSVLYGKKTTALTWKLEKSAWMLTKYFARFWDPNYYRTYQESKNDPKAYWSVESEIKRALQHESDFIDVDNDAPNHTLKTMGLVRDSQENSKPAWVVQDENYLSARWPGDAHTLAKRFIALVSQQA
jgi:putative intracellular protease/amidase